MEKIHTEYQTEKFLENSIKIAKSILTIKPEDVEKFAKKVGFPLYLKIISKQALHKTDVNGVEFVDSECELLDKFDKLIKISNKRRFKLEGILVQEHVKGVELIVGLKKDQNFGHVIMFGLGGVYTELFNDVTFRVCPINKKDAESMIDDLKGKKILEGFRGKEPCNIDLLKQTLVKISKLPQKNKKIKELDINPLILNDKVAKVADARMITE